MKVLVVGDKCVDEFIKGTVDRISPEAPVPVLKVSVVLKADGMAANVAANLKAFGVEVDSLYNKERIVKQRAIDQVSGQHLLRIDIEHPNIKPLDVSSIDNIQQYGAIVVSDYDKGFITYDTVHQLRKNFNGPILIDSKKTDLVQFEGCIVKINELESKRAKSLPRSTIVTLGSKGAVYGDQLYPAEQVEMFDVCGAGDTFLAGLTYKVLCGESIGSCIEFANKCAAIVVQHRGTYTLKQQDIESL